MAGEPVPLYKRVMVFTSIVLFSGYLLFFGGGKALTNWVTLLQDITALFFAFLLLMKSSLLGVGGVLKE